MIQASLSLRSLSSRLSFSSSPSSSSSFREEAESARMVRRPSLPPSLPPPPPPPPPLVPPPPPTFCRGRGTGDGGGGVKGEGWRVGGTEAGREEGGKGMVVTTSRRFTSRFPPLLERSCRSYAGEKRSGKQKERKGWVGGWK